MAIKYQPSNTEKPGGDTDKKSAPKPDVSKEKPKSGSDNATAN